MKHYKHFFSWLYTLIHWEGCEKLTIWDKVYKRRVGFGTAWRLSKIIANALKERK